MEKVVSFGDYDEVCGLNEKDNLILEIYNNKFIQEMAPRAGLEPATERLTAACSTTELPRN